jgi:hypothetical protein
VRLHSLSKSVDLHRLSPWSIRLGSLTILSLATQASFGDAPPFVSFAIALCSFRAAIVTSSYWVSRPTGVREQFSSWLVL